MKILVTGARGFIGKNLVSTLKNQKSFQIMEYDIDTPESVLRDFCKQAEFVFHLAGVNRPKEVSEFMSGNAELTTMILDMLENVNNKVPVMISSSIQAELDNEYGRSKKAGEDAVISYGKKNDVSVFVYRFVNVFGKWCRPNYNSAVATFCYNIAHDLPITVNDPEVEMNLVYIDDLVAELLRALTGNEHRVGELCQVPVTYKEKLGTIASLITSFKENRLGHGLPDVGDPLTKKLYSTYLSYLPESDFCYPLKMNIDERGSFTEVFKTVERGQVSINISKPGIVKGNHWHHSKNEKFLVVSGQGVIRFRKIDSEKVIEYYVNGETLQVVDIPPGYTHNIENLGERDMVTVMWANESFDPHNPDTWYESV